MADSDSMTIPPKGSTFVLSSIGLIFKAFLFGANRTEIVGLENLTRILDRRINEPQNVESALITGTYSSNFLWSSIPVF